VRHEPVRLEPVRPWPVWLDFCASLACASLARVAGLLCVVAVWSSLPQVVFADVRPWPVRPHRFANCA